MSLLKPIDEPIESHAVVIEEVEGEPQAIGLPRSLQKLSEAQRREWLVQALKGKEDDQRAA